MLVGARLPARVATLGMGGRPAACACDSVCSLAAPSSGLCGLVCPGAWSDSGSPAAQAFVLPPCCQTSASMLLCSSCYSQLTAALRDVRDISRIISESRHALHVRTRPRFSNATAPSGTSAAADLNCVRREMHLCLVGWGDPPGVFVSNSQSSQV